VADSSQLIIQKGGDPQRIVLPGEDTIDVLVAGHSIKSVVAPVEEGEVLGVVEINGVIHREGGSLNRTVVGTLTREEEEDTGEIVVDLEGEAMEVEEEVMVGVAPLVAMSVASMVIRAPTSVSNVNFLRRKFNKLLELTLIAMITSPWRLLVQIVPHRLIHMTQKRSGKNCSVIHSCAGTRNPLLFKSGVSPLHRQIAI